MGLLKILLVFVLAVRAYGAPKPQMGFMGMGRCGSCNPTMCVQVSCSYGVRKDNCGCCNMCMPGPGQPCGNQVSVSVSGCGTGLSCNQGTCGSVQAQAQGIINVGVQIPMPAAAAPQQCGCGNNCVASTSLCAHGHIAQSSCGCCNQCASGAGEPCGNGCGNGLQCQGGICLTVSVAMPAPARMGGCGCAVQGCTPQPQGCHFGIAVSSSCSCCKTCASGPGMTCNSHTGGSNCGHGLSCVQNTCQTTVVQVSMGNQMMMGNGCGGGCQRPQTNCMHGHTTSGSCGCKTCASGMGQPCGNGCSQGLQCMQNICVNIAVGMGNGNGFGTRPSFSSGGSSCGGCGGAPIGMPSGCNCAAVSCPAISSATCQYGMVNDACGCCNVCAAAPGGTCGSAVGVSICSRNNYCNRGICSPCSRCEK